MAIRAVRVLRVLVMLWTSRLFRANTMRNAVTRQTELPDTTRNQQADSMSRAACDRQRTLRF